MAKKQTSKKKASKSKPQSSSKSAHSKSVTVISSSSASSIIDARIAELAGDWRGKTLVRVREVMRSALPDVVEEWKWDVPVWSSAGGGIVCTGEVYKAAVKLTFAKGAAVDDPDGIFNSSLEGKTRRAIDFREGEAVPAKSLASLVRAVDALNRASKPKKTR